MSSKEYMKVYLKAYYKKNKEKSIAASKQWNKDNPDKRKQIWKKWREAHKEQHTLEVYKWRKANPEKVAAIDKRYLLKNSGKVNAKNMKRYTKKKQRIPKWANSNIIKQFYINCPKGYEVDHIIPLQGKNVSGLHVENNLQYLTKSKNISKGNKYEC